MESEFALLCVKTSTRTPHWHQLEVGGSAHLRVKCPVSVLTWGTCFRIQVKALV